MNLIEGAWTARAVMVQLGEPCRLAGCPEQVVLRELPFDRYEVQHGKNPEHVKLFGRQEFDETLAPLAAWVVVEAQMWLDRVHEDIDGIQYGLMGPSTTEELA